ncbi:hypothetical protein D3C80_1906660 [compost metagenome]
MIGHLLLCKALIIDKVHHLLLVSAQLLQCFSYLFSRQQHFNHILRHRPGIAELLQFLCISRLLRRPCILLAQLVNRNIPCNRKHPR